MEKNQVIYQILWVVFKRKGLIFGIGAVCFLFILFVTYLRTPTFKATAKILIRSNPKQQLILFKDLSTPGQQLPTINPASDLIQILTGQEIAEQVVERFKLDQRLKKSVEVPESFRGTIKRNLHAVPTSVFQLVRNVIGGEKPPKNYFSEAVDKFMKGAQDIQLEEKTNVISLSIWEESPGIASDIANYMSELLIQKARELEQSSAREAYVFTKEHVAHAENALAEAEEALIQFRKHNGIISLKEQKEAKLEEIKRVDHSLIDVRSAYSEAQARLAEMNRKVAAQRLLLSESPMLINNSLVRDLLSYLNQAEIELAAELERYTETSESVKALRAKSLESGSRIEKELQAILRNDSAILQSIHPDLPSEYARLVSDVAAQEARRDALQTEMDVLKADAFGLSEIEAELETLNRRRQANEDLYKTLLAKLSELGVQQSSHMSGYDLKIIDKAFIPENSEPDQPKWLFALPLGMLASFLLGVGVAFSIEYWDESFKSAGEVEEQLGVRVLCTVPDLH